MVDLTAMQKSDQYILLSRHFGTWQGKTIHFDPEGNKVNSYETKIEIGCRGSKYSQRNTYTWPDGKKAAKEFHGEFDSNGKLTMPLRNGLLGECIPINNRVLMFVESGPDRLEMAIETITLCGADMKLRNRTNQILDENGMPKLVTNLIEKKVSEEDVYFEK